MKTRYQIITIVIALLSSFSLQAQVSIGFRTGTQWANIAVSEGLEGLTPDFKNITGYSFGAVVEIPVGAHFAIQPELAFTRKGFGIKEDIGLELFDIPLPLGLRNDSRFGYLEMPVLAKYKFGNQAVQAYVMAGPSVGYATHGRIVTRARLLLDFKVLDQPIDLDAVNYERIELGAVAGAGVNFNLGGVQLFVDGRYSRGFTQVYDIPVIQDRVSNRGFGLNAGLLFAIR